MTDAKEQFPLEDLRQFAALAGLGLSEDDLEQIYPQLASYLEVVSRLHELDLSQVEPATTFRQERA